MQLTDTLTDAQHRAIVECLKIAARRGRELRLARERAEREIVAPAGSVGTGAAGAADNANGTNKSPEGVCTDAQS